MWCVLFAFGLVRVEVSEMARLDQGSLAVGDACGGGRGECTDAGSCAVALPRLALQGWALPSVAWCYQGLTCCAEKRPQFSGRLQLPDGSATTLRVHDHMPLEQVFGLVDEALAERGIADDYKLEIVSGAQVGMHRLMERRSDLALRDYGILYPQHFQLSANLRLRGGIANGDIPAWAHVPFVVKLKATYEEVDPEDGEMKYWEGTCTGALVGPYVFSAAHCFKGKTRDPAVWTAIVYRAAPEAFRVGDVVVVWDQGGIKRDAIVTAVRGDVVLARPVGWSGEGFTWDHMEGTRARKSSWDHVERSSQQALRVVSIWNHDLYDSDTDTHDFAILEVDGRGFVPPTPPALDSRDTALDRPIIFGGFGEREDGESGELRTAILSTERCWHFERESHGTVRCASSGPDSAVSTCVGDSGGPVFYNADAAAVRDYGRTAVGGAKTYILTASNSFGYMAGCGDPAKKTGVSMIAQNREFIERVIPREQQRAWLTWV